MSSVPQGLIIAGSIFGILIFIVAIIKSRYKIFTNNVYVLQFRMGRLRSSGFGGGYFVIPIIDELITLSTTIQNLEINAGQVISQENQDVEVAGFVIWRIEDPEKAYQSISGTNTSGGVMSSLNKTLEDLTESIIRTTVARLTIDQVLRERSLIIEAIMLELIPVVSPMGIKIATAEIRHVEVLDKQLFNDLQEKYRQNARLKAEQEKITTGKEISKSQAQSEQEVRLFEAEQEERARVRELAKDRNVLLEDQKVQEAEELRKQAVESLELEKKAKLAGIEKRKLEIEAQTKLMQIEFEAESKKRRQVLEQIEVEAQQKRLMAEAEADAIKVRALANRDAAELEAEAEALKLERVAEAKRKALEAEAKGRKALLLAEAEGLREKVKAQGFVNDAMIMQELVKQLPEIAASMKVGDINWLNMGGGNGNGETPLGIIPKNLLEVMSLSKAFGLDVENLVRSIRGKDPLVRDGMEPEQLAAANTHQNGHNKIVFSRDDVTKAVAVKSDDGEILGFDTDHDGDIDFRLPHGVMPVLTRGRRIKGFDLTGNGEVDFVFPEKLQAIDVDGDGTIDGLSLDDDEEIDVNLHDILPLP